MMAEVTSYCLTENLFKLMTEVIERVLKTFEVVSTADFFLECLQYVVGQRRFCKLKCLNSI